MVSFGRNKDPKATRSVTISSVVTEKEILDRSEKLEDVINSGKFTSFCDEKVNSQFYITQLKPIRLLQQLQRKKNQHGASCECNLIL